jgi:hypothetical protein
MPEPAPEQRLREQLFALAAGELTSVQILQLLDELAQYPDALGWLRHEHWLRLEAERAVRRQTPAVPTELRERIERLNTEMPTTPAVRVPEQSSAINAAGRRVIGLRGALLIAAAALVAGIVTGLLLGRLGHR